MKWEAGHHPSWERASTCVCLHTGVGNRGMLDMKAVLYKEQQEAERAQRDPVIAAERRSRRTVGLDVSKLKGRNQGVDQRNTRDMQHVKVSQYCLRERLQKNTIYRICNAQRVSSLQTVGRA